MTAVLVAALVSAAAAIAVLAFRYASAARRAGQVQGQLAVLEARRDTLEQERDAFAQKLDASERQRLDELARHRRLVELRDEEIARKDALLENAARRDPDLAHEYLAGVLSPAGPAARPGTGEAGSVSHEAPAHRGPGPRRRPT